MNLMNTMSVFQQDIVANPGNDLRHALFLHEIREQKWPRSAHFLRVALHDAEVSTDIGGSILLVDDEQVGTRDARAALARNLVAFRYIDDKDCGIGQFRAEGR